MYFLSTAIYHLETLLQSQSLFENLTLYKQDLIPQGPNL